MSNIAHGVVHTENKNRKTTLAAVARPLTSPLPYRFSADRVGRNPGTGTCVVLCRREAALGSDEPRNGGKSVVRPGPWNHLAPVPHPVNTQNGAITRNQARGNGTLLTEQLNLEAFSPCEIQIRPPRIETGRYPAILVALQKRNGGGAWQGSASAVAVETIPLVGVLHREPTAIVLIPGP